MQYPWVQTANRVFIGVLTTQLILTFVIAFFTDTWSAALTIGIPMFIFPIILILQAPNSRLTHFTVGIGVQLLTALHIQQTFGLTEIHFEIFVVIAFLSFYRDWQVILGSVLVVAVHHVLFFILQSNDAGVYVFEASHLSFSTLVIHALFAVAEAGVLMFVAKNSFNEAQASFKLTNAIHQILDKPDQFNLTINLDTTNPKLEQFNRLITSFKHLLKEAKTVSHNVSQLANHVSTISNNIQDTTRNSDQQTHLIATATEQMTVTINDVAHRASEASQHATESHKATNDAKEIIEQSSKHVAYLKDEISGAASSIDTLSDKCNYIGEVMMAIKSVSEQTNLLALNAAIESARAGEHGRGFAVVADEVRQLATKTRESAEEITVVTNELINEAGSSVSKMHNCLSVVNDAVTSSNQACDVMDTVVSGITIVSDNIASVATAAEQQTSVANSIATSTQELQQSSNDQVSEVGSAQREIESLRANIQALNAELAKFTL
ncbi:chemotaxis protein [Saccharobesus litoralis]|uniref:Chemotaxis protein n=1 Tax=Saccharobesus litoralis TaxID=2172099 RepID=A0A2S0VST3_9ALTE|nr:methyl-accepting chemotaxis protein [Saccharobesus litoralis]AWB67275.1 chemotaxis protein [Saccharobesus litoralis]